MSSDREITSIDTRVTQALADLNRVGEAINRPGAGDSLRLADILRLIVKGAARLIPEGQVVIAAYDPAVSGFDADLTITAGSWESPRPESLYLRAIEERRTILSWEEPNPEESDLSSSACLPLLAGGQGVGILSVTLPEKRPLDGVDLLLLANFANLAGTAMLQSRSLASVHRDLARKDEELKQLRRTGLLISSRLRLEETLEAILQMALEVTNAQYGIFRLMDKTGQFLITRAIAGEQLARPMIEALPNDTHSVMGWVARTRQPVCIADLHEEPWRSVYYPLDAALEMRAELAVPLISASGRLEGVLNLESPRVGAFTEQDSHLLQAMATQAVIAIQEARLLDVLQEVAQLLLTQPGHKVHKRLVELACDLLNGDTSAIWILKNGQLVLQAASGSLQPRENLAVEDSLAGKAIGARGAKTAVGTGQACPDLVRPEDCSSALAVPLLAGDTSDPVGAFSVYSSGVEPGRFAESEWDIKVLTCLAYYAALAVQSTARQEALRSAQEQRAVAETFAVIGDIAANVLHHLNNKVGTIPVRIQGVRDKARPALESNPYLASNLNEIERSANEAMAAVRENLSHLRPINLAEVDVASSINAAVEAARLPVSIQLRIETLTTLPPVLAGQRTLTLVFTNLLSNAADAMRGLGSISISGTAVDGWVEIILSDSGPGIAPELHDRIFELNYSGRGQARGSRLGFGLWWVKTLMARLGGSVTVESDGVHGATFRLKLPAVENR